MKEASAFDDYDKENGYEDEEIEENKYVDILFQIIRYGMRVHKMSYSECMDMDIVDYIDYLEFDMVRNPIESHSASGEFES
ncbi:hypothetical protein ACQPVP_03370 [Clostridium nigeriense]|uniref:hypothetical protein n=1 Tax=Clostridium nigeriense TaxID=1805470 RepID=UPI003D33B28E